MPSSRFAVASSPELAQLAMSPAPTNTGSVCSGVVVSGGVLGGVVGGGIVVGGVLGGVVGDVVGGVLGGALGGVLGGVVVSGTVVSSGVVAPSQVKLSVSYPPGLQWTISPLRMARSTFLPVSSLA